MVSLISNSESMKFFNEYLISFNWQTERKRLFWTDNDLFSFSTAQAEKNFWKKIVKQTGENF